MNRGTVSLFRNLEYSRVGVWSDISVDRRQGERERELTVTVHMVHRVKYTHGGLT